MEVNAAVADGSVDPTTLREILAPLDARPRFVVGQLGQSLDGRIATVGGHSHYINGPEDIHRLHAVRALVDAVIVGARTVASDDPRLTVRRVEGANPTRVVLDPSGRLHPGLRLFQDSEAPTLWIRADERSEAARTGAGSGVAGAEGGPEGPAPAHPPGSHVEVVGLPCTDEGFAPQDIVELLADRGLGRVLVEGGGRTVSGFLAAKALDRLHISVAPLLIGSGRPSITLPEVATLDEAMRPPVRHFRLGDDLLFDLDLRAARGPSSTPVEG